jgi:hypothetical protein
MRLVKGISDSLCNGNEQYSGNGVGDTVHKRKSSDLIIHSQGGNHESDEGEDHKDTV